MEELISIVVPVYNAETSLARCVSSLLAQTPANLEVILVNDGSRDGSLAMCRKYARMDPRVRVIDKANGGVSSARNAGLDAATGEYIMFCDSDDWVEPDWCAQMLANFAPQDLTICQIAREDVSLPENSNSGALEMAPRKELLHYPMVMCALYNKIFLRKVIENNCLRFPVELSLGEDFVFVLTYTCAISGSLRILYRELYHYDTSNENSLSGKTPSLDQCDRFYHALTGAMKTLEAMDSQSVAVRDRFVMSHFERLLTGISLRKDLSAREKVRLAKDVKGMESFFSCRGGAMEENPVYRWLFHNKAMGPAMLFLILRNAIKNR